MTDATETTSGPGTLRRTRIRQTILIACAALLALFYFHPTVNRALLLVGLGSEAFELHRLGAYAHRDESGEIVQVAFDRKSVSLAALDRLADLRTVRIVAITDTAVTAEHVARLAACPHLTYVSLYRTNVSDSMLQPLAGHEGIGSLFLGGTPITDESVSIFESMPSLHFLEISNTQISEEAVRELAERRRDMRVSRGPADWSAVE